MHRRAQWSTFIFKSSVEQKNKEGVLEYTRIKDKLKKIPRAKYPAVTEEEERISIPLQTMCGAIFDAILYVCNRVPVSPPPTSNAHAMCMSRVAISQIDYESKSVIVMRP